MNAQTRRRLAGLLVLLFTGLTLAACEPSVTAGAATGGFGLVLAAWLLAGVTATQAGCAKDPDPDSDARAGADSGEDDGLSAPLNDLGPDSAADAGPDANIGPCLDIDLDGALPDAASPDGGVDSRPRGASAQRGIGVTTAMPILPCLIRLERYPNVKFGFCSIGTSSPNTVIDPLGNVRASNLSSTLLGNVREQTFAEVMANPYLEAFPKSVPDVCRGCAYERSCQGGCKESGAATFGRLDAAHLNVRVEIVDLCYEGGDPQHLATVLTGLGPFEVVGVSCESSFDDLRSLSVGREHHRGTPRRDPGVHGRDLRLSQGPLCAGR